MSLACPRLIAALSPDLCRAIDHYCERTDPSLWSEPVNALTNAAFPLGAWFAWRLAARHTGIGHRKLVGSLIILMAIVGFGSFLFHTVATRWAEWGDVIPILGFMLLYLWLILTCFFRCPAGASLRHWPSFLESPSILKPHCPEQCSGVAHCTCRRFSCS